MYYRRKKSSGCYIYIKVLKGTASTLSTAHMSVLQVKLYPISGLLEIALNVEAIAVQCFVSFN